MGKLKELFKEYMQVAIGSQREKDIVEEVQKISQWMQANGYATKPVLLPSKARFKSNYNIKLYEDVRDKSFGIFCGGCAQPVELTDTICKCGHPLGCVVLSCGGLTKIG